MMGPMSAAAIIHGLDAAPSEVAASWPDSRPLVAVWSGGAAARSRWTILGRPAAAEIVPPDRFMNWLRTAAPFRPGAGPGPNPSAAKELPFIGGWIGWISYDAGGLVEPAAAGRFASDDRGWPAAQMARVDDALVYDHAAGVWWGVGAWRELMPDAGPGAAPRHGFEVSKLRSAMGRAAYTAAVERALAYIRAGDVYQVNLAHRLSGAFRGSARGLFLRLMEAARPWFGGYMELAGEGPETRAVVSASPELFFAFDPTSRRIVTRPMKGTRPGGADPRELDRAEKDRAELNMIVDLMRNDLQRVCAPGTVVAERLLDVESYSAVHQLVSTVAGRLTPGTTLGDLLDAAFPAGSMTGAPKLSAMAILNGLEKGPRGLYAGCFGWVGTDGRADLAMTIRSIVVRADAAYVGAGGGITWLSDPDEEVAEVGVKARGPLSVLGAELPPGW